MKKAHYAELQKKKQINCQCQVSRQVRRFCFAAMIVSRAPFVCNHLVFTLIKSVN